MNTFLDLMGASGTVYRFRTALPGAMPAMGGNYVVVGPADAGPRVLVIGMARDLSSAPLSGERPDDRVYTRLNVSRTVREAEHADLVAAYGAARVEALEG